MVRPEFRLPRRDVDSGRAIFPAALAAEAQRQRVLDLFAVPAVADDLAAHHFVEQMRPPPSAVLLLVSDEIGRAHDLVADTRAPAFADADAVDRRLREPAELRVGEPDRKSTRLNSSH